MQKDILKGKWKQIKGAAKEKWGELTDDEIEQVEGNFQKLTGKIQEKYGITKEKAEEQVNDFMEENF